MRKSKEITKLLVASALVGCLSITNTINVFAASKNTDDNVKRGNITKVSEKETIKKMRELWKDDLTGGKNIDVNNEVIAKKIAGYVKKTGLLTESMNTNKENDWLWDNLKDYKTVPASITSMLNNIYDMAMAYSLPNDKYYKNDKLKEDILYALDWVNEKAYNDKVEQYGNWWDWMIGIPARLNNIVILMYDDLSKEQINNNMNAVQKFLPSIEPGSRNHTGANLADVCINKLLQGVILEDTDKIKEGSEDISSVFEYVTSGDGFYPDGSYVQHGIVAYTGSYGNVLIDKVSNLMFLLEDTPWKIKSENKNNIYKWVFESFDPIIYKGYVMDMVRGRSISRHNGNGYIQASGIIEGMIKLSMIADDNTSLRIQKLVKQWGVEAAKVIDYGSKFKSINVINNYYKIMNDDSIVPSKQGAEHHALNMMDKTIHEREDFALAIARSSNRISKYEFMNKENLHPWFQGDGMMYLYNNDLTQFSEDFWPTVDPYRMPGTTVDTRKREDKDILPDFEPSAPEQDEVYYELTNSSWSGGTKMGNYGVSGMQIDNKYDSLKANKSWFMFDDEIVSLGSGITNPDNFENETIVENRKLTKDGQNKLTIDGKDSFAKLGDNGKVENAKWAHLQGNVQGSDIGYYFPDGTDLNVVRDEREGSWKEINGGTNSPTTTIKNNYLTMYIDHGKNIKNEKYSYVLLPNKSKEEVAKYASNSNVEIVRNDDVAQGVKHKTLNMEGANFFKNGENKSGTITSSGKSSVMVRKNNDETLDIAISDPTFEGDKLTIYVDGNGKSVVSKDDNITNVSFKDGKIKIDVNVKNTAGKTFNLKVKTTDEPTVEPPKVEDLNAVPKINGENIVMKKGDTWNKDLHKLSATDKEDGDLNNKIKEKEKNVPLDRDNKVTKIGDYSVVFEVEDKDGAKASKKFTVKVEDVKEENSNGNIEEKPDGGKLPSTSVTAGAFGAAIGGLALVASGLAALKKKKK
ncbi:MAG: polysaccharide lyase family 8 super-sandwich domain-containing protein [Clostridium sp.]|uniref:polysaccharide lyase family 8 super-sandwich domain-containing protein n=1 Tax=Clostridium sp. TaxID=1506 RepID=UPI003F30B15A